MKRYLIFILSIILIPNLFAITGESITGEFSQLPTNVSVFVQPTIPIPYIFSPENTTYYSQTFLLNYSIKNSLSNAWYNLDNGQNISLSNLSDSALSITSSYGYHSLYLYANNTLGENSYKVSFSLTNNNPPEETPKDTGGGGGGGGGGGTPSSGFSLDKKIVETSLVPGESTTEKIKITNLGSTPLEISVDTSSIQSFALVKEEKFKINPGETKEIEINFFSLQTSIPSLKFGKIIFKAGGVQKELNLILNVKERQALFDLNVEVLPNNKEVSPGKKISTLIEMTNIGMSGTAVDVDLLLSVVDFDKKEIFTTSKNVLAVKTNLSFTEKLQLPQRMPEGTYLVVGELKYNGVTASSYDTFEVKGTYNSSFVDLVGRLASNELILILLVISLSLIIFLIIILIIHISKKDKPKARKK